MTDPTSHAYSPGAGHTGFCSVCGYGESHPCHQPAPVHETAVSVAEVGPAAIDGLSCQCRFRTVEAAIRHGSETGHLVDPDVPIRECALHKAVRERVAKLERLDAGTYLQEIEHFIDRAEAAEARPAEFANPRRIFAWLQEKPRGKANAAFTTGPERQIAYMIETAELLAAEAAEAHMVELAGALERARAKDEVVAELLTIWDLIEGAEFEDINDDDDLVVVTIQAPQARRIRAKLDALNSVQRGIRAQEFFGEPEGMATHEQSDFQDAKEDTS